MNQPLFLRTTILLIILFGIAFFLTECGDPCKETICKNGGACIDGTCDCPAGFSGEDCSTLTRDLYLGTYNVTEECPNLNQYTVNIFTDTTSSFKVKIANFSNAFSNPVSASINGLLITIPSQSPDNDGRSVSGNGNFVPPDKIIMQFTVSGSGGYSCSNSMWQK